MCGYARIRFHEKSDLDASPIPAIANAFVDILSKTPKQTFNDVALASHEVGFGLGIMAKAV